MADGIYTALSGAIAQSTSLDSTPGAVRVTGRGLDVAEAQRVVLDLHRERIPLGDLVVAMGREVEVALARRRRPQIDVEVAAGVARVAVEQHPPARVDHPGRRPQPMRHVPRGAQRQLGGHEREGGRGRRQRERGRHLPPPGAAHGGGQAKSALYIRME